MWRCCRSPRFGAQRPSTATAHTADYPVALGNLNQQRTRGLGHVGVIGMPDDRRKCAVDIKQNCGVGGIGAQRLQRLHEGGGRGHEH